MKRNISLDEIKVLHDRYLDGRRTFSELKSAADAEIFGLQSNLERLTRERSAISMSLLDIEDKFNRQIKKYQKKIEGKYKVNPNAIIDNPLDFLVLSYGGVSVAQNSSMLTDFSEFLNVFNEGHLGAKIYIGNGKLITPDGQWYEGNTYHSAYLEAVPIITFSVMEPGIVYLDIGPHLEKQNSIHLARKVSNRIPINLQAIVGNQTDDIMQTYKLTMMINDQLIYKSPDRAEQVLA